MALRFNLIRNPTVADQPLLFKFDVKGYRFLVKNHTDGDVHIAMREGAAKEESALIPAGCAQIMLANDAALCSATTDTLQVIADTASDKGVEIQCIRW